MFKMIKSFDFKDDDWGKSGDPERALIILEKYINNAERLGYKMTTPVNIQEYSGSQDDGSVGYMAYVTMYIETPPGYETYYYNTVEETEDKFIYNREVNKTSIKLSKQREKEKEFIDGRDGIISSYEYYNNHD